MNSTYILKCADSSYYVGSTTNLHQRIKDHNTGKGAEYTAKRKPCRVVYFKEFVSQKEALKYELQIKKISRVKKEKLIFCIGSVWKHYRTGDKYIILDIIDDSIIYGEYKSWQEYKKQKETSGCEYRAWIRSKSQWLDWVDKEKGLLRFNLVM